MESSRQNPNVETHRKKFIQSPNRKSRTRFQYDIEMLIDTPGGNPEGEYIRFYKPDKDQSRSLVEYVGFVRIPLFRSAFFKKVAHQQL